MLANLIDKLFIKQPWLRRLVTRALYGRADTQVSLLGADLDINSALENGYLRAYRASHRLSLFRDEIGVLINLAALVEDDTCFLDVGANIGIFSSVISRLRAVHPGLHVMAFEVDPVTYGRLSRNAARHGFTAINCGIAEIAKEVEFLRGAVSHVTAERGQRNAYHFAGGTFLARIAPLTSFDPPGNSLIIKIDVEGLEYEVLQGARPFFQTGRVKAVYLDGCARYDEVMAFLKSFGLVIYDGRNLERADKPIFSVLAIRAAGVSRS